MKTIATFILSFILLSLWAVEGSAETKFRDYNYFRILTPEVLNQPPQAVDDQTALNEDVPATGNVLTNDTDADGNALTASLVTAPVNGTIVLNADGSFTYTPNANYTGTDSFTYQVCDNGVPSLCDTATVLLTITGINDPPSITGLPSDITVMEDSTEDPLDISSATISDVDAGSGALTLTLTATGGIFDIAAGTGIASSGHLTNILTLTGNLTDLNSYINIPSNIYFRPTQDLNGPNAAEVEVSINDNGHTGSGGGTNVIIGTVNIDITPVNDAPVNSVPVAQSVAQDGSLVFSAGNGNLISISDVDAGGGNVRCTLTATNGLITLGSTTGLTFISGNGAGDDTMTFEASIGDINAALNGVTFAPSNGYNGTASIQLSTSDLGLTGAGGTLTDSDIINITVNALTPEIIAVSASTPDGIYKQNDVINIRITFNQAVVADISGGSPKLLLETGSTDRQATYLSGSGSNALTFSYTVQENDQAADLDYKSITALSLNGSAISNSTGDHAVLTLPAPGSVNSIAGQHNIMIDGIKPLVASVSVPPNGIYNAGSILELRVNFNEKVNVETTGGTPHINLVIGAATHQATYTGGTGTSQLSFSYTVQAGDMDMNGIAVDALVLNGGTVKDQAGNDAVLTLNNVATTTGVLVNTASPTVVLSTSATSPINQAFTASITFSEAVTGLVLGDILKTNATLSNLQTTDNISYTLLITPIADGSLSLQIPAGVAVNIGNNNNTASNTLNLTVDASGPIITSVSVPADAVYKAGNQLNFIVNYNENVVLNTSAGIPSLNVVLDGVNRSAIYDSGTGSKSLTFRYTIVTGDLDVDGIALGTSLVLNAVTLRDAGGNIASLALNGVGITTNVRVDAVAPAIPAGFEANAGNAKNSLTWEANTESDLESYKIYAGTATNPTTLLTTIPAPAITYLHHTLLNGTTYYYRIAAVDQVGNESALSSTILAKPMASQVITFDQPSAKIYGDAAFDLVGSSDSGLALTYTSSDPSIASISGKTVNILKAGTVQITATQLGNETVKPASPVTRSLDIDPKLITVTAVAKSKAFGAADPELTYTFNPELEGTDAFTGSLERVAGESVGTYAINQGTLALNSNYTLDFEPANLVIGKKTITVSAAAKSKAYGAADPELTYTFIPELEGSDAFTGSLERVAGENAGIYAINQGTLELNSNYTLDFEPANLVIGKKTITVTAAAKSKAYGAADPELTYTFIPELEGSDAFTGSLERVAGENAGTYAINQGTLALNSNYILSYLTASLTIDKTTLTITAENKEKFAGTTNPPLTIKYDGFALSETPEVLITKPTISTSATTSSPAGDYPILVSGAAASNYELKYVSGNLKVKPGAPTDMTMESTIVYENGPAKTKAGAFSSVSGDPSATYTYSFVTGSGDMDNALFSIENNSLFTKNTLDFENKSMYSIRIKTTTQYGLSLEKAFTVTIIDVNEAPTLASISNSTICYTTATQTIPLTGISAGPEKNQTVTLDVKSDNPTLFQNLKMSSSGNNTSLNYNIKGGKTGTANITVTVTDDGGIANGGINIYSKTFVLTVNPLPVILITSDKGSNISKGDIVVLTASGASSYVWTADNSIISGQNTATLTVRPTEHTTYTVKGSNATGCSITQSFSIKVAEDLKLIANNIVTPNGDGYNDKWIVQNIDVYPDNLIKIFDRAGRLLYTKKGYDNSWDATYNGNPLNEDTYYYIMEFTGSTRKFKGYITVVREN